VGLNDLLHRPLRDLRVSVTDRCNFRCTYCMPKEVFGRDYLFLDREQLLSYEQISRLASIFVGLGVRKIRITGGEPLLRRDIDRLISMLAAIGGLEDLTLTTNGALLEEQASRLGRAGLQRVTVSLDSLDNAVFRSMNDAAVPVTAVLAGIDAAAAAGLRPIKINAVVRRGVNDHTLVDLARRFHGTGHIVRFIEYMDVGTTNGWRMDDVVTAKEIINRIDTAMPIEPVTSHEPGPVAQRWRYRDGGGEIGVIASVSEPFCGTCTRMRLAPEGKLYTCLFASEGHDLKSRLDRGDTDEQITEFITEVWQHRRDEYSQIRSTQTPIRPRIEMSYIGG